MLPVWAQRRPELAMPRPLRILFLSKRFPQGRDLMTRPYGRFYHLAQGLAAAGHEVHIATLSYRGLPSTECAFDGIRWRSDDLWPTGPLNYLQGLRRTAAQLQPDWVIGVSDLWFGILATRLAVRAGARSAIDAYDNFEAYMPWARPVHQLWRRALGKADLVTAAGPTLAARLIETGASGCEVLPMTADPAFHPRDRGDARRSLGLPVDRQLIGHLGAFNRSRGHAVLLRAVQQLQTRNPQVSLVLSGRDSPAFHAPPAIYGLGYLRDEHMPLLVNALDVACISLADTAFGRYSYPAKLCEAMACEVPVVATDTPPTRWMLGEAARFLSPVGDADALSARLEANLGLDRVSYPGRESWTAIAARYAALLVARGPKN